MSCQEEISISWAYYTNAHGSRRHGSHYVSGTPAKLFWKGKGFALAGTGAAVETLSRDKTARVLR